MAHEDLEWFLYNLESHLRDRALEDRGYSLECFWDTSDVMDAVLGLESFYDPAGRFDRRKFQDDATLIRCLLGAGWFGKIRLLQPHQTEFLRLIDSDFGLPAEGVSRPRVEDLIKDSGLNHFPIDFKASQLMRMSEKKIAALVRGQAENAPTLFKIAYCDGISWKLRLVSWVKQSLLEFDDEPFDYAAIFRSEEFQPLKDCLDQERPRFSIANYADAVAICQLALKVRAFSQGLAQTVPRFFASHLYQRVLEKTHLQHILQYHDGNRVESVLRDRDYYKFKAILQPLDAEQLSMLYQVREQIMKIQAAQRPLSDDLLATVTLAGKPLTEVIQSLRQFWFLENVWLPFGAGLQITKSVGKYIASAYHIRKSAEFRDRIESEIKAITDTLKTRSEEYRRFTHLWRALEFAANRLQRSAADFRVAAPPFFQLFDLLKFGFPADQQVHIECLLHKLLSDQHDQREALTNIISHLQKIKVGGSDGTALIVSAALLWVLKMDDQIVEFIEPIQSQHYSLGIVAAASRVRAGKSLSEYSQIIKYLKKRHETAHDINDRFDLGLSLGYLYYYCWQSENRLSELSVDSKGAALLEAAISYTKVAYTESIGIDFRRTVYGLNQYLRCLLSRTDEINWSEVNSAATTLLHFMGDEQVWQYRFDDTLATYHEKQADRTTVNAGRWLEQAWYYIDRAWIRAGGDEEIAIHRSKLLMKLGTMAQPFDENPTS